MFKYIKIGLLMVFGLLALSILFWYLNHVRILNDAAKLLSGVQQFMITCSSKKPTEFPIEDFDDTDLDPECVKNTIMYAKLSGEDRYKINPEKNCKCLKKNIAKVIETHMDTEDECLPLQAGDFVKERCLELSIK